MLFYNVYLNLIMKADGKGGEVKLKDQLCFHLRLTRGLHAPLPSKNLPDRTNMNDGIRWRPESGSYVNLVLLSSPFFWSVQLHQREKKKKRSPRSIKFLDSQQSSGRKTRASLNGLGTYNTSTLPGYNYYSPLERRSIGSTMGAV